MPQDPRLPPGTDSVDPDARQSGGEAPRFRRWAEGAENSDDLDALIANFLADYGIEMMADLIGDSGSLHRTAEGYVHKLAERFERWWDEGCPRLHSSPKLTVHYHTTTAEREAHEYLEANVPPGVVFLVARRMTRTPGGAEEGARSQMKNWVCRIEDGPASSGGQGHSAAEAARRAVSAWREFVTGSRIEVPPVEVRHDAAET